MALISIDYGSVSGGSSNNPISVASVSVTSSIASWVYLGSINLDVSNYKYLDITYSGTAGGTYSAIALVLSDSIINSTAREQTGEIYFDRYGTTAVNNKTASNIDISGINGEKWLSIGVCHSTLTISKITFHN